MSPDFRYGSAPGLNTQGTYAVGRGLEKYSFYYHATEWVHCLTPLRGGSRNVAGRFGAHAAPLTKYLDQSHYDVDLTPEERRRITLWLDLNSGELGAYKDAQLQLSGAKVWPMTDMDSTNPTGVEHDRPLPATSVGANALMPGGVPWSSPSIVVGSGCLTEHNNERNDVEIRLYDLSGRVVLRTTMRSDQRSMVMNPRRANKGNKVWVVVRREIP